MVVEPGMKHSWYIFISSNGNQLRRDHDSCNDTTLCDGSRMNRNTQFRKYLYRLRYDSVIDPKVIQQWKYCMKLYVLQLRN